MKLVRTLIRAIENLIFVHLVGFGPGFSLLLLLGAGEREMSIRKNGFKMPN
jgi:hypothetical protein